jgi:exosortase/archaeosortase family protein
MNKEKAADSRQIVPSPSGGCVTPEPGSPARAFFGKLLAWYHAKGPVLMFVLGVAGLMSVYYAATLTPLFQNRLFPACMRFDAAVAGVLLNMLGQTVRVHDATIFAKGFAVDVRRGCDAIDPLALFVSAVLAFPGPLRRKLPGAMVGALVLLSINVVRIVTLFLTGVYYPRAFPAVHADVWQIMFILLTVVLWAIWIRWAMRRTEPGPNNVGG